MSLHDDLKNMLPQVGTNAGVRDALLITSEYRYGRRPDNWPTGNVPVSAPTPNYDLMTFVDAILTLATEVDTIKTRLANAGIP